MAVVVAILDGLPERRLGVCRQAVVVVDLRQSLHHPPAQLGQTLRGVGASTSGHTTETSTAGEAATNGVFQTSVKLVAKVSEDTWVTRGFVDLADILPRTGLRR